MKKTVKSKAALHALALERGLSVKDSRGRTFNDGKKVSKPAPKPPAPKVEAPPPPPPKPIEIDTASLERAVEGMAGGLAQNTEIMQSVAAQLARQASSTKKRHGWSFNVFRDDDGLIEKIIATPVAAN